jgi:hypothetical protein
MHNHNPALFVDFSKHRRHLFFPRQTLFLFFAQMSNGRAPKSPPSPDFDRRQFARPGHPAHRPWLQT